MKNFFRILFAISALTYFAACSNFSSVPYAEEERNVQTDSGKSLSGKTLSGKIVVSGALPRLAESSTGLAVRTAFPKLPEDLTYEVTAKKAADSSVTATGSVETAGASPSYTIYLSEGAWIVTITAKSGTDELLSGQERIVIGDANETKNFILTYSSEGTDAGSVSLPINFQDDLSIAKLKIQFGGQTAQTVASAEMTHSGETYSYRYQITSLAAGSYPLKIYFLNSSDETLYFLEQVANVYSGLTTDTFYGDEDYIDSGEIKITQAVLDEAALTVFYVKSDGLDTASGSYFNPVKTLAAAVALVNNSTAEPAEGFKIIILSDITAVPSTLTENTFSLNSGKSLRIETDGESTQYKVTGGTKTFISQGEELTVKNLKISAMSFKADSGSLNISDSTFTACTGFLDNSIAKFIGGGVYVSDGAEFEGENISFNTCIATGSGGAIYSEGKVTLTSCEITNCSADLGGAVYSEGQLTVTDTVFTKNSAKQGGAIYAGTSAAEATVELTNCRVGAVSASSAPASKTDCTAAGGNASEQGGGAVMLGDYSSLKATDTTFNGNFAGGAGGAVNASSSHVAVKLDGGELCFNNANTNGGALQVYSQLSSGSYVKGAKIQGNKAGENGGAVSVTTGKYFTIDSCTEFSGNTAEGLGNGCYAAGNLRLKGSTYIADGIYLNTKNSPVLVYSDFALSGTEKIPLRYNADAASETCFTANSAIVKGTVDSGNPNTVVTQAHCDAFDLGDEEYYIKYRTTPQPYIGLLAKVLPSTTLEVGTGKDYATLKEALAAVKTLYAENPDDYTILVCDDETLTSDITIDTPGVTIKTENGSAPTISGAGNYKVTVAADDVEIDGVNFTALKGGINVASGELTINNSVVENGISVYNTIVDNYAAGITVAPGAKLESDEGLVIKNCDSNNDAVAGILNNGGTVDLTGAEITGCDGRSSGGGIYSIGALGLTTAATVLTDCRIHDNSAGSGGGIYCIGSASVELKGSTEIYGNTATYAGGGGVYIAAGGSFTMEESVRIHENTALNSNGGGIYIATGTTAKIILNSTKDAGNTASSGSLCYAEAYVNFVSGSSVNGTAVTGLSTSSRYWN